MRDFYWVASLGLSCSAYFQPFVLESHCGLKGSVAPVILNSLDSLALRPSIDSPLWRQLRFLFILKTEMAAPMNVGYSRTFLLRLSSLTTLLMAMVISSAQSPAKPASTANDVPAASQIQPEELVQTIKSGSAQKPVVLYVGPKAFYTQAHIPGAELIGPVGRPEGMDKLRARAASLPKDSTVVIYCGCCPWDHCPNIRPAFAELKKEGFTKVRVLYLATSFGVNWAEKGFPVAKGE
jgi:thiosulfate/3-mercaptopyruvate sulfurtransferase